MGKFQPGNPGRPKGIKSKKKKTKEWEKLHNWLVTEGAEKYILEAKKMKGASYSKMYVTIMEFFEPKMQRIDHTTNGENINQTKVIFPSGEVKELPEAQTEFIEPEKIVQPIELKDEHNTRQE